MRKFGLIGKSLDHSFSPAYFLEKFRSSGLADHSYDAIELKNIGQVADILGSGDYHGLNVTIPYKEAIIPYLDAVNETAAAVGAVNTIVFDGGITVGHNTDVIGFERSLIGLLNGARPAALIFGTGGAAKAVAFVLRKLGIDHRFVSRQKSEGSIHWTELGDSIVDESMLLINCTPIGMFPNVDDALPLPYYRVGPDHFAFDLVYNPSPTRFLQHCADQGAQVKSGGEMLKLQAEASWDLWNQE